MAFPIKTPREKSVASSKGTWEENITQPDVLEAFSPRDLINRFLSTNLIARPMLNYQQVIRTIVGVLSSKPGGRPFDLMEAIKSGIETRMAFNKARIEKIKENWRV